MFEKLDMGFFPAALMWICAISLAAPSIGLAAVRAERSPDSHSKLAKVNFSKDIRPILEEYCIACHGEKKKGGLDFRVYTNESLALRDRSVFEKVLSKLEAHEMPPTNKPQPTAAQAGIIANWVIGAFFYCDCNHPDPGRVTIRRLNRGEYNNTIHDLAGVDFQPAEDFPADDSGYGFDNIGDVLSVSPVLMEKYLAAAEKIINSIFDDQATNRPASAYSNLMLVAKPGSTKEIRAREIIMRFAARAFRRPLTSEEQKRLMGLFRSFSEAGESFDHAIKLVLEAVLISPQFLFRGDIQAEPDNPKSVHQVDDYALASRLSYFLWSSMPDEELFAQAKNRSLHRNLESQVKRMLTSEKSQALVDNFAGQWLQLRNLKLSSPDRKQFPAFNDKLRAAMEKETSLFFQSIWRENRSVLDFIGADYTFLNERLATLYGIEGIEGDQFRRVGLNGTHRGGLLTQASIMTITSNPTRTSPVKRGKWVLENILGAPPPPPPPNVPELKEGKEALKGPLRHRMEQHRSDPNCASCHARMDPIGFGFENFDAIGAWRDKENEFEIDASGKLITGESFQGPEELKQLLLTQRKNEFVRCLSEKMLTYALGRGLEYYDKCAVDQISKTLAKENYTFSSLVIAIVKSTPFQMRRGETSAPEVARSDSGSK